MPSWATWVLVGVLLWFVVSVLLGLLVGAFVVLGGGVVGRAERAKALSLAALLGLCTLRAGSDRHD